MTATFHKHHASTAEPMMPNQALLIEDNPTLLRLLAEFLQQHSYDVKRIKTLEDVESLMSSVPESTSAVDHKGQFSRHSHSNDNDSAPSVLDALEAQISALMQPVMANLSGELTIKQVLYPLFERPLIKQAMIEADYSQVKAAKRLGMNRNTLRAKLKQLGLYNTL